MVVLLTDEIVRSLSTAQSFERGLQYYRSGAIYNTSRRGNTIAGECEGSTAPSYRLQAVLDEGGVLSASCTCPYDRGGYCKHIIALLLAYIHKPEEFVERKELAEMLTGLEREALVELVVQLVDRNPELYDWLETTIPVARISVKPEDAPSRGKRTTQVSEQAYRRQVKSILRSGSGYDDEQDDLSGLVEQLDEVRDAAYKFLDAGDPEGTLTILKVLLEEVAEKYESFYDEGELAGFIDSLGMPFGEAILSADLTGEARDELSDLLNGALDELQDYSIEGLDVALAALEHGWAIMTPKEFQGEENEDWDDEEENEEADWDEDDVDWEIVGDELTQAQLNVLERQGRLDEFLKLCERTNSYHRYILKLLDLGRKDDAVQIAMSQSIDAEVALATAQKLRDLDHLSDAITVGERGLSLHGQKYPLASWLAPLEEAHGRQPQAVQAYQTAFDANPSFELYKTLQRLTTGQSWDKLKPRLIKKLQASPNPGELAAVYLHEEEWDAAIQLAEKSTWDYTLLEKIAGAVIPHRPDWVIRVSRRQAEALIAKTQSKLYPVAARWLAKMKKAYVQAGREAEWQAYFDNLKTTYARRPALQAELRGLV